MGLAPFDDAAVFRVADDLAVVSTTSTSFPRWWTTPTTSAIAAAPACRRRCVRHGWAVALALTLPSFMASTCGATIAAILARAATVDEAGGTVAEGHHPPLG